MLYRIYPSGHTFQVICLQSYDFVNIRYKFYAILSRIKNEIHRFSKKSDLFLFLTDDFIFNSIFRFFKLPLAKDLIF